MRHGRNACRPVLAVLYLCLKLRCRRRLRGCGSDDSGPDWEQTAHTIEASAGIAEPSQNFLERLLHA